MAEQSIASAKRVAAFLGALFSVIATPLVLVGISLVERGRLSWFRWILLHLNAPARIALWLLLSYGLAFGFLRWGNPERSRKSSALNALGCLLLGTMILATVVLVAAGSVQRLLAIVAAIGV